MASIGLLRSVIIYYGNPFRLRAFGQFYSNYIHRGDLCFDIGAHVGNRTASLRKLGARVVAVEPQPVLINYLASRFDRDPDVILIPKAVGSRPGNARLHISSRTPTVSSLSQEWIRSVKLASSFHDVRWDEEITVQVTTLDALLEEFGLPEFVKIDVEGFESEALQGLSSPIPLISFEYIPVARGIAIDCLNRLSLLGNYAYNWTVKESTRLQSNSWLTRERMIEVLALMLPNQDPGDIYCKRVDSDRLH